jgi:Zn finger protein HypA/HybF involved in hydrogenase expression
MAIKQIETKKSDMATCPRCGEEAILIEGRIVVWLNCPKCKFKKLMEKKDDGIKITSLK